MIQSLSQIQTNTVIQKIDKKAFSSTPIENIKLPNDICELEEGWLEGTFYLKQVTIELKNEHFSYYLNGNVLLGKSDKNNDEYDTIIFVSRTIQSFTIPPNIREISSYSFQQTSIKSVAIPSESRRIKEGAFSNCQQLRQASIQKDSKLEIVGKSSFSASSIESIFVPTKETEICEGAFSGCKQLRKVEFANDSVLQIIGKKAFESSSIEHILIPPHVKEIRESSFNFCRSLLKIEFSENCELQTIGKKAFSSTPILTLYRTSEKN